MTAYEMIRELEKAIDQHGDLAIYDQLIFELDEITVEDGKDQPEGWNMPKKFICIRRRKRGQGN